MRAEARASLCCPFSPVDSSCSSCTPCPLPNRQEAAARTLLACSQDYNSHSPALRGGRALRGRPGRAARRAHRASVGRELERVRWTRAGLVPAALRGAKLARRAAASALWRGGPFPGARLPQHAVAGPPLPRRAAALGGSGPCPGAPLSQFATAPARRAAAPAWNRGARRAGTGGARSDLGGGWRRVARRGGNGPSFLQQQPDGLPPPRLLRPSGGTSTARPSPALQQGQGQRLPHVLGSVLSRISGHGGGRLCSRRRPDVQASAGANGSTGLGVLRPVSKKGKYIFLHLRQPP